MSTKSSRRKASRSAGGATDQVRAGHQLENRETDRVDDSAECPGASGPGDQVRVFQFAVAAILLVLRFPAEAQQPTKVPRIGFLIVDSPSAASTRVEAFKKGLQELGYVEGKNITLEYRYAEGKADRLPQLASELVRLNIDVLVTGGGNQVAIAAMKATGTIPIVMTNVADPLGSGFVASLARPGGNVTGLTSVTYDLSGKRLELIKETLPRIGRIAVLYDPSDRAKVVEFKEMQTAAGSFAVQLQSLEVRRPEDFESALARVGGRAPKRSSCCPRQ
jgi:putative tryptophan/tyrosine transport system substrate-binding protein